MTAETVSLSDRQQRMLEFIVQFYLESEFPPSIREIGEQVGISSTSVVNYNLTRLVEADLVTRQKKVSRGLALNWPRLIELNLVDESDVPPIIASHAESQAGSLRTAAQVNGGNGAVDHAASEETAQQTDQEELESEGRRFVMPRVPLVGTIAAGQPISVNPSDTENPLDWIDVTESMLAPDNRGKLENVYALRVQGDSMIDASIKDGDIVILRHQEEAQNGQMVAAWIDGEDETTLKYWHAKGKTVELVPDNPAYEAMTYASDQVRVVGRVISVIRTY